MEKQIEIFEKYGIQEDMETSSKGSETDDEEVDVQEEDAENEHVKKRRLLEEDVGDSEQGRPGSE